MLTLAAAALAVVLHVFRPLPWFGSPFADILLAVGVLAIAGTVALDISAIRALRRAQTTVMPHKASARLVSDGAFAISRNPIYVGNTLLLLGTGLVAGIAWFLPLAFVAAALIGRLAIRGEEQHLEARFGKAWRDYAKRVRRWI